MKIMFDAITATQLAMEADQFKLQSISHNISNMNTPGFKRQVLEHTNFTAHVQKTLPALEGAAIKTQGSFNQTHSPTDMAISGEGYFQVQGEHGIFYTRRGDFQINSQGELSSATGEKVLGQNGALKVEDHHLTVNAQGVLFLDHQKWDQLNVVQFNQANPLHYLGNGLYQSDEVPLPIGSNTHVLQGFIEQSNVKSIDEMMDMIKTSRHFELCQRVMRSANNLLSTAINQLGEKNV